MSISEDDWQMDVNGWDLQTSLAVELEHAMDELTINLYTYMDDPNAEELEGWEPPSGYVYDGCTTCDTREALVTLVPIIAQAAIEGRIRPTQHTPPPPLRLIPVLAHEEDNDD
jgi:hypothetical protein